MTATFASSPWTLPVGPARTGPWVFGREVLLDGAAAARHGLQWRLPRNCSISPRELGLVYFSLCTVSMVIATFFFVQGATLVPAFAGAELLAVGAALLVFVRHAADREVLTLVGRSLQVEQCFGTQVSRTDFVAESLHVEPAAGQGSLVELRGRGRCVRVGRFLRPELRSAFARELRLALRLAPMFPPAASAIGTEWN